MEFNGVIIKKICLGGRPVNKVQQTINGTDTLIWETTDAPEILLSNPRVVYANAGGYQYLSAKGYSEAYIGDYANDYAYVVADVLYSYRGNSFKLAEDVQLDVTAVSSTGGWLSIAYVDYTVEQGVRVGGRAVAVAANRGATIDSQSRTGAITGVSIVAEIDGVSKLITMSCNLPVVQEHNIVVRAVTRPVHYSDAFNITSTAYYDNAHACPAGTDGEYGAVVTATGVRTTTQNRERWLSSGNILSDTTSTTDVIPTTNFRFFLTRAVDDPYKDASLYPGVEVEGDSGWEYDDGTTYGNNQRIVTFGDMGTDPYPDGRYVDVYVEAYDDEGRTVRPTGSNTIRLYQAANTIASTVYRNPVGTISLGNWEMSGTDTAVSEGEDEPVDTAVLEAYITVTKRETYSSGSYVDTPGIATSFDDGSLRVIIPSTYPWITQSANGIEPDHWRNIHVGANGNTTARTGYPSVFVRFGSASTPVQTFAVKQAAFDDGGGDGPEPED